jgi:hypothetical protein
MLTIEFYLSPNNLLRRIYHAAAMKTDFSPSQNFAFKTRLRIVCDHFVSTQKVSVNIYFEKYKKAM